MAPQRIQPGPAHTVGSQSCWTECHLGGRPLNSTNGTRCVRWLGGRLCVSGYPCLRLGGVSLALQSWVHRSGRNSIPSTACSSPGLWEVPHPLSISGDKAKKQGSSLFGEKQRRKSL